MTQCPRCLGRVYRERDHYGDRLCCLCCGWSLDCAPDGSPLPPQRELYREFASGATRQRRSEAQKHAWAERWAREHRGT